MSPLLALPRLRLEKENQEAHVMTSGWVLRPWSPGGDTILGGGLRKAAGKKSGRQRKEREGLREEGKENVEMGKRMEKRKLVGG